MERSRTLPTDIQRDTRRTNKTKKVQLIPYRFEETDPNLEMRASGEIGVNPLHYVGVA